MELALSYFFLYLFALATHKEALVSGCLGWHWRGGGWSPSFLTPFNGWEFEEVLLVLQFKRLTQDRRIGSSSERERMDVFYWSLFIGCWIGLGLFYSPHRLIFKEGKNGCFSMKFIYRMLDWSRAVSFPSHSIGSHWVSTKVGLFFAWKAVWAKVLVLDQLQRRGRGLPNRCFLCEQEETVEHLLLHCPMGRVP